MTVMDFGCGPEYLAGETACHTKRGVAVDISPGAIACARVLNGRDNVDHVKSSETSIDVVNDESIDLISSLAVVQHMHDDAVRTITGEWFRVLKAGGTLICHVAFQSEALSSENDSPPPPPGSIDLRSRHALRMRYRAKEQFRTLLGQCGFEDVRFSSFDGLEVLDDVAREPFIVCSKP